MLVRLFRKMLNNRWMVLCLLAGFILATAMMSSVPIYTGGALQRMLFKDLENYQLSSGYFPGSYTIKKKLYGLERKDAIQQYKATDKNVKEIMFKEIGLPALSKVEVLTNDYLSIASEPQSDGKIRNFSTKIEALSDIEKHINIIQGKMFSTEKKDDAYEVIVSDEAMQKLDVILDKVYPVYDIMHEDASPVKVKVVGVYTVKDKADHYWFSGIGKYSESLIMDYNLLNKEFIAETPITITDVQWYYALDYYKIKIDKLNSMLSVMDSQANWCKTVDMSEFQVNSLAILKSYGDRASQLRLTLWVLQVPIMIMLIFYLFMVSQLIMEQEKNEIAVFKSRGASSRQIFGGYFIESIILSVIALIVGPPLGLLLCTILGASNGFMEFVQRKALPVTLSLDAYKYSLYAVIAFIITMLIPVIPASKTTIVQYKQKKSRGNGQHIWQKYFLDVLLLLISCYGLYSYKMRQGILKVAGVKGTEIPIDPLLFLMSTLFILSAGLVFLRVFPYMVRFIFFIGRKIWPPALYASLTNVGRAGGKNQFLMLFLILTISIGIFNANAARTVNSNVEEKVKYQIGADITMKTKWDSNEPPAGMEGPESQGAVDIKTPIIYQEPPFSQFAKLGGIDMATKVFRRNDAVFQIGDKSSGNGYFMSIIPNEFGKVAWFRDGLLPYHWYKYLNLMSKDPRALLVSRSFEKKYKAKVGDSVYIKWGGNNYFDGIIFAFIDYWPTYNPFNSTNKNIQNDMVIANFSYTQAKTMIEPYEVWYKKTLGATSSQIYEQMKNKNFQILELKDTNQQIVSIKNDPMLQGTNGALTLGFVVTMVISTIGFLIYWILSIKDRTLQFGIFRAMGISMKEIIKMLISEQLLISGTAIIMGILVGGITSDLFVPLLQITYSSAEQVPPFKVVAYSGDYIKLYIIIAFMLLLGFAVLARMISKIKINQAIKLGED